MSGTWERSQNSHQNNTTRTRQREEVLEEQRGSIRTWRPDPEIKIRDREQNRVNNAEEENRELSNLARSRRRNPTLGLLSEHPVPRQERNRLEGGDTSWSATGSTANLTIRICFDRYPAFDIWDPASQQYIRIAYPDASDNRIPREQKIAHRAIHRSFLDANNQHPPNQDYNTYINPENNTHSTKPHSLTKLNKHFQI